MKMIPMFESLLNIKLLNEWKIINLIMNVESKVIGHVQSAKDDVIAGGIYYFDVKCCDELKFARNLFGIQDVEGFECTHGDFFT